MGSWSSQFRRNYTPKDKKIKITQQITDKQSFLEEENIFRALLGYRFRRRSILIQYRITQPIFQNYFGISSNYESPRWCAQVRARVPYALLDNIFVVIYLNENGEGKLAMASEVPKGKLMPMHLEVQFDYGLFVMLNPIELRKIKLCRSNL